MANDYNTDWEPVTEPVEAVTEKEEAAAPVLGLPSFSKRQILKMDLYRHRVDLLSVLIDDEEHCTLAEVERRLLAFLGGEE